MKEIEYLHDLKKLQSQFDNNVHLLNQRFVESSAKFKKGDIIKNVTGMIRIEYIRYEILFDVPQIRYVGTRLKKVHGEIMLTKNNTKGELSEDSYLEKRYEETI